MGLPFREVGSSVLLPKAVGISAASFDELLLRIGLADRHFPDRRDCRP